MNRLREFLPNRSDYKSAGTTWRKDLIAGITVGIVALPLALAFGITTGAGAAAGLITAILAGLIAAIFGGSNFQVSGPTGAMTVVLVPIVTKYGVESLIPLGFFAGLLTLVLGIFHAGSIINRVPWHGRCVRGSGVCRQRIHHVPPRLCLGVKCYVLDGQG